MKFLAVIAILLTIGSAILAVLNFIEGDVTWGIIMVVCFVIDGYWSLVLTAENRANRS